MATQDSFEGPFQQSRLLDLIQKLMLTPVHDQIGAIKEEVGLAIRLAAEAELKATSTDRNLQDEISRLRTSLNTMGEMLCQLAFSYFATRDVLIQWVLTSSLLAASSSLAALRNDSQQMLQLAELSVEHLDKINDLALEARSVNGPEGVLELEDRRKALRADIMTRLRATIPPGHLGSDSQDDLRGS